METCNFYPVFEKNQILTAEQLNELTNYLEKQERLTRRKLVGIGVLCGLEVKTTLTPEPTVMISKGCGITAEGYLITTDECTLTRYKPYTEPTKYSPFWKEDDTQIPLSELLPEVVENEDETIQDLTEAHLKDKVVLLYLERKEVDLDTCTGEGCNELGIHVELCLKKLLIIKSDLESIIENAYDFPAGTNLDKKLNARFQLPEVNIGRANNLQNIGSEIESEDIHAFYVSLVKPVLGNLENALGESYERFSDILERESNPFSSDKLSDLFESFAVTERCDIQYFYDFLIDLIFAYNEFKDAVFDLLTECCPDEKLFPRHLMLGDAVAQPGCGPSMYRQRFISAPIYNHQEALLQKVRMLFERMVLLVNYFEVPDFKTSEIRITPSREKGTPLGKQAIPYYYRITKTNSINRFWDFELMRRCRSDLVYSYNAAQFKQAITPPFVLAPLSYNIEGHPFLRIEGHIGKNQKDVEAELSALINKNNLPIKAIGLKFGGEFNGTSRNFGCRSDDLELIYVSAQSELVCLLEKEIRFFATIRFGRPAPIFETGPIGVRGVVRNEKGNPLAGINVSIRDTKFGSTTDKEGKFDISTQDLEPGTYKLFVSIFGFYKNQTIDVEIAEDRTSKVDIQLEPIRQSPFVSTVGFSGAKIANPAGGAFGSGVVSGSQPTVGTSISFGNGSQRAKQPGDFLTSSLGQVTLGNFAVGQFYKDYTQFGRGLDTFGFADRYFRDNQLVRIEDLISIFDGRIRLPVTIINKIESVVATLTEKLPDFEVEAFGARYDELVESAENYKQKILEALPKLNEEEEVEQREILDHLNFLIESCSLDKFHALFKSYENRQIEIQKLNLFKNYLPKHPGLEHQAGVNKGGTFVFVYDEDSTVCADFSLPYICCSDCPPIMKCTEIAVVFKLPKAAICHDDDTDYKFILSPPGGEVTGPGVERDLATGDFNFNATREGITPGVLKFEYHVAEDIYDLTVPIIQVEAQFEHKILNIDVASNTAEVEFIAAPSDGDTYEWDFGEGTTVTEGNNVHIHTYQDITSQPFDVKLKVTKAGCDGETQKSITVTESTAAFTTVSEEKPDFVQIEFKAAQLDGDEYTWTQIVGGQETQLSTASSFTKIFQRTNTDQSIQMKLDIKKGTSQDSQTQSFTIPAVEVSLNLKKTVFCKNDPSNYELIVSPSGGLASGSGVIESGGKFLFLPASDEIKTENVELTYNAPDSRKAKLTVQVVPIADLAVQSVDPVSSTSSKVTFLNNSTAADRYTWDFGGVGPAQTQTRAEPLVVVFKNVRDGQGVNVKLTAVKDSCVHTKAGQFTIKTLPAGGGGRGSTLELPGGGNVVIIQPGGGGLPPQTDPVVGTIAHNQKVMKALQRHSMFNKTLKTSDPAFKGTNDLLNSLTSDMKVTFTRNAYIAGQQNTKLAETFDKLFDATFQKIKGFTGSGAKDKRAFVYAIFLIQTSQLLSLIDMQKSDLKKTGPLFATLNSFKENLKSLKDSRVNINPDNVLKDILSEAIVRTKRKSGYKKVLNEIVSIV